MLPHRSGLASPIMRRLVASVRVKLWKTAEVTLGNRLEFRVSHSLSLSLSISVSLSPSPFALSVSAQSTSVLWGLNSCLYYAGDL